MAHWWVYVVQRGDGALYTGVALNVDARFAAHCAGRGAKALRGRGPLRLLWRRRAGPRGVALRAEARVKRMTQAAKRALGCGRGRWRALLAACQAIAGDAEASRRPPPRPTSATPTAPSAPPT